MPNRSKKIPASNSQGGRPNLFASSASSDWPPAWAVAIIMAVLLFALYGRAIDSPLFFDDHIAILENKSITTLWPPIGDSQHRGPLNPEPELPVSARPLVNLSFAVNHYFAGLVPRGYHQVSVVFHLANSLLLWLIVRRTLRLPYFAGRFAASAGWLAFALATLWAIHPLQTEVVAYATQRTELMMAFFYFATLYCSLRYWSLLAPAVADQPETLPAKGPGQNSVATGSDPAASSRHLWLALSVLSCLCGMASKEVMVSAPVIVLLFDRAFVSGSLMNALRRSWPLYVGLCATVGLLLFLIADAPRSESAGFHLHISAVSWWYTQSKVLLMYLKLVVWPSPLLIHSEFPYLQTIGESWLYVAVVAVLAAATLVLLYRNTAIGFLATFVFAILSPTFVIPIVTEMAAERRMYLPLTAILATLIIGGYGLVKHYSSSLTLPQKATLNRGTLALLLVIVLAFWLVSANRVANYNDPLKLFAQVIQVEPMNHVAHQNMAYHLQAVGEDKQALEHYREAVRVRPDSIQGRFGLCSLLLKTGQNAEAIEELKKTVVLVPNDAPMRNNLASALSVAKRYEEAIEAYKATLKLEPNNPTIYRNFGITLQEAGKYPEAIEAFQCGLRLSPTMLTLYLDLAKTYTLAGEPQQADAMLHEGLKRARAAGDAVSEAKFTARLNAPK